MRKLAIATAVGAAALLGGSAANADSSLKTVTTISGMSNASDFSAQRRHRHHGYSSRRVYRSYGYAPRRVYYAQQPYYAQPYYGPGGYGYGYGGPGISFGFGGFGSHHGGFGGGFGGHGGGHH